MCTIPTYYTKNDLVDIICTLASKIFYFTSLLVSMNHDCLTKLYHFNVHIIFKTMFFKPNAYCRGRKSTAFKVKLTWKVTP